MNLMSDGIAAVVKVVVVCLIVGVVLIENMCSNEVVMVVEVNESRR